MTKGKMIAKEVDDNSGHSESDEMEMVRAIELDLKHDREDLDFNVVDPRPSKKPRYHRHTPHQINGMEAFYRECPHPGDKQRRELGRELGLEPPQVKFWFQNKRNQAKTQLEHMENIHLRVMNERLRVENMMYKEALCGVVCACCGSRFGVGEVSPEELQMKTENDVLRKEIYRISTMARMYVGKPLNSP